MSLSAGDRIGSYEIAAPIGRGGMGEVYRARDLKLKCDVAVKVLPVYSVPSPILSRCPIPARSSTGSRSKRLPAVAAA
jgi:serine/threonine protein kinase